MAGERGNRVLRLFDRWAGVPLTAVAGLFSRRREPPQQVRRVGVLCLGCIGDLVLLSGPIADLLSAGPEIQLTVFCSKPNEDVARMIPGVADVVVLPVKRPIEAARLVRAEGLFDVWIDSGQWPRINALLSYVARAQYRVGFYTPGQHRHFAYDAAVVHRRDRHELENFRALMAKLGVAGKALPTLGPTQAIGAELPTGLPRSARYAVLHIFPGGYRSHMKEWPLDRWASVAAGLAGRGLAVLLSGGPADRAGNQELVRLAGEMGAKVMDLSGVRIGPTAGLLANAALCVSVNTGIMHLAAAMGTPLLSLNGPVSVERWGPVTRPGLGVALRSGRECAPCLHLGFEYACHDNLCMRDIEVEEVFAAVDALLSTEGSLHELRGREAPLAE